MSKTHKQQAAIVALLTFAACTFAAPPIIYNIEANYQQTQALPDQDFVQGAGVAMQYRLRSSGRYLSLVGLGARWEGRSSATSTQAIQKVAALVTNSTPNYFAFALDSDQTGTSRTNWVYSLIITDTGVDYPLGTGTLNIAASAWTGASAIMTSVTASAYTDAAIATHAAVKATTNSLGHVIVGSGLAVDGSGVLSAAGGSVDSVARAGVASNDVDIAALQVATNAIDSDLTTHIATTGAQDAHGMSNTVVLAAGALPKTGGTMTGDISTTNNVGDPDAWYVYFADGVMQDGLGRVWKSDGTATNGTEIVNYDTAAAMIAASTPTPPVTNTTTEAFTNAVTFEGDVAVQGTASIVGGALAANTKQLTVSNATNGEVFWVDEDGDVYSKFDITAGKVVSSYDASGNYAQLHLGQVRVWKTDGANIYLANTSSGKADWFITTQNDEYFVNSSEVGDIMRSDGVTGVVDFPLGASAAGINLHSYMTNTVSSSSTGWEVPGTAAQYIWTPAGVATVTVAAAAPPLGFTITHVGTNSISFPATWDDPLGAAANFIPGVTNVICVWPNGTNDWQYIPVAHQ